MNVDALAELLEAVRPYIKQHASIGHAYASGESHEALLRFIAEEPALEHYGKTMVDLGSFGVSVSREMLLGWLLSSVLTRGARGTAEHLAGYLDKNVNHVIYVLAVSGVRVESAADLGHGIRLIPLAEAPGLHSWKHELQSPDLFAKPEAALIRTERFTPIFGPSSGGKGSHDPLDRARLALTLVGPCGPAALAFWWAVEQDAPGLGDTSSGSFAVFSELTISNRLFGVNELRYATELVDLFLSMDDASFARFKVVLGRLNQAIRRQDWVDKAIDLGICLEALLLHDLDGKSELAFQFRLRGSLLAGESFEERKSALRLLKNIYTCRSTAVHDGILPSKLDAERVIVEGINLAARITPRVARLGRFSWEDLILDRT